jgi:hypothetical protein
LKIINKPIKVLAIFNKDGSFEPAKFDFEDTPIRVQKIMKKYEEKAFGKTNIYFVCMHNGRDIFELKYVLEDSIWYLYKM